MTQQIFWLIAHYRPAVVFLAVLAEQIGLPVPALPVLVVAGGMAAAGRLPLAEPIVASLIACVISDFAWFWAGRRFGMRVLHALCRLSLTADSCIHQSELRFQRWRGRVLVVAKFIPGLSLVTPPLVGALGLKARVFLVLDTVGALLWTGFGVGLGYLFSAQIDLVLRELHAAGTISVGLVLGLLALFILAKWLRRRRVRSTLQMARITAQELRRAIEGNLPPVVIDVRSAVSRQIDPRIIRGAMLANLNDIDRAVEGIPRRRELVTYCSFPNEATSARAARTLIEHGYRRVHPLQGGLLEWEEAGYPVEWLTAPAMEESASDRESGPPLADTGSCASPTKTSKVEMESRSPE